MPSSFGEAVVNDGCWRARARNCPAGSAADSARLFFVGTVHVPTEDNCVVEECGAPRVPWRDCGTVGGKEQQSVECRSRVKTGDVVLQFSNSRVLGVYIYDYILGLDPYGHVSQNRNLTCASQSGA